MSQDDRTTRRLPRGIDPPAGQTVRRAAAAPGSPGTSSLMPRRRRIERQVDDRSPFRRLTGVGALRWMLVDTLAVLSLLAVLVVAFMPTFVTWWLWVTVLGGGLLGALMGWAGARLRLGAAGVTIGLVALWFTCGGALAMPSSTQYGVVPTVRTLKGLSTAPVTAWKSMLTLEPPIGETWNLLCVPLVLAMLVGVGSLSISLRTHRPQLAWLPGVLGILGAWALGTHSSRWPVWVAIATVAIVLVWTSFRRRMLRETFVRQRGGFRWHQVLIGVLVLALAGGATWWLAPRIQPDGARLTARQAVTSPLDVQQYGSPLQSLRGVNAMHRDDVMLTVAGVPQGGYLRLATLDTYNGFTYNVSNDTSEVPGGPFTRVGARITPLFPGTSATTTITLGEQAGVWVPTVGQTAAVDFQGSRAVALGDTFYYNRQTGTALSTHGLGEGDRYVLQVVVPPAPSEDQIASAGAASHPMAEPEGVPDLLRERALRWTAGSRTKGQAAQKLVAELRRGYYSNGLPEQTPSLSGHSAARLLQLVTKPDAMVGDEEQYSVAMALMARSLGMPARVVYGYQAPEGGSGEVRGRDIRAWTEINLDGLGWVLFNPTPDHDRVRKQKADEAPPRPRPHVENPPPPPRRPEKLPNDTNLPVDKGTAPVPPLRIDWKRVGTLVAVTAVPLLTLFGPVVLILGLKMRRRRLRRHNPDMGNRVAGAWSELVDRVRDLGQSPPPTATRSEQAELMVMAYPTMITDADPISLAKRADGVVFAPDPIPPEQANAYWKTMRSAEKGVRRSVGWRRWLGSRLSVRSFRKYR